MADKSNTAPDVNSAAPKFDPISRGNHGTVTSSYPTNGEGRTKILETYGKDDSDYNGPANKERNPHNMGGSITNLAHSLTGVSANQKGS